ncbi:hypothetical protein F5051DRAFT_481535 [Lentinula edodes]|nr:hypothetical protein F5051DRAFT_481535 [Lentinula edodes]
MALSNFPIDKSYLIATWLASAFWGAFTVIFIFSLISTFTQKSRPRNVFTIAAVIAMYTLSTVHISLVLTRIIEAFIVHVGDDGGAISYLANIGLPLNRSKDMIYVTTIVMADTILLWRCLMVWNKNYWVIALPGLLVLTTAITGYGAIAHYFLPDPYIPETVSWAIGMLITSMATNIIVTILTAGRIWQLTRRSSLGKSNIRYNYVILMIIESGLVMAISKTLEFILFELAPDNGLDGLNALYIVMDCMPQIMGICPTAIILAVNRGFSSDESIGYVPSSKGMALRPMVFQASKSHSPASGDDGSLLPSHDLAFTSGKNQEFPV